MIFESASSLITTALAIWLTIVKEAVKLILVNPEDTSLWSIIDYLMGPTGPITSIGRMLVVIFFLAGWIAESTNPRQDMRPEMIIKLFVRIIVADYFVTYNLKFFTVLYSIATGIASLAGDGKNLYSYSLMSPEQLESVLNVNGLGEKSVLFIIGVIFFVIVVGSAFVLFNECYFRIIKVCMIIPFGSLTMATMASGNQSFTGVAASYLKYMAATLLEMFMMLLAIKLCAAYVTQNMVLKFTGEGLIQVVGNLCMSAFGAILIVSLVKGSKDIVHRLIGG